MAELSELKKARSFKETSAKHELCEGNTTHPTMITHGRLVDQVKQAEIKMAAFVVEHNLPFRITPLTWCQMLFLTLK